MINPEFWKGKRVFITGHTGFKGAWLCLWLKHLGAHVTGYALAPPSEPSLFEIGRVSELIDTHHKGDVRDLEKLETALHAANADIVIHMAAQTLVRHSYAHPVETFSTNVLGAVNVLDSVRRSDSVKAVVVVTSDKCYYNQEWVWGYREDERVGGDDPYSSSKGCAELVVHSYQQSFFSADRHPEAAVIGSGRAGNVIGGGDWGVDRLVPDIMRSLLKGEPTIIRNPQATRPWQHVLEPLHGYLVLAERLFTEGHEYASGWNFGPAEDSERTVGEVVNTLYDHWKVDFKWERDKNIGPPESTFLKLDASKARAHLDWQPKLNLNTTLAWIVAWFRSYEAGHDMREVTLQEIERFMAITPQG